MSDLNWIDLFKMIYELPIFTDEKYYFFEEYRRNDDHSSFVQKLKYPKRQYVDTIIISWLLYYFLRCTYSTDPWEIILSLCQEWYFKEEALSRLKRIYHLNDDYRYLESNIYYQFSHKGKKINKLINIPESSDIHEEDTVISVATFNPNEYTKKDFVNHVRSIDNLMPKLFLVFNKLCDQATSDNIYDSFYSIIKEVFDFHKSHLLLNFKKTDFFNLQHVWNKDQWKQINNSDNFMKELYDWIQPTKSFPTSIRTTYYIFLNFLSKLWFKTWHAERTQRDELEKDLVKSKTHNFNPENIFLKHKLSSTAPHDYVRDFFDNHN